MGASRTSKQRTASQCREWERQRRIKFNEAIETLGELIKTANSDKDLSTGVKDNVQYAKVEIIQRAIAFVKQYSQERLSLKSEIIALQVKLDGMKSVTKKDASTQITKIYESKLKSGKHNKLHTLKKCKNHTLKSKQLKEVIKVPAPNSIPTENNYDSNIRESTVTKKNTLNLQKIASKPPKENKAENTFVVVPAAPYLIPQRPLLLPTMAPAFVLFNPNMQQTNKALIPKLSRTSNDVTKTTMVNILPITAYSRPHSASNTKRNNVKPKTDVVKKKCKVVKKLLVDKNDNTKCDVTKNNKPNATCEPVNDKDHKSIENKTAESSEKPNNAENIDKENNANTKENNKETSNKENLQNDTASVTSLENKSSNANDTISAKNTTLEPLSSENENINQNGKAHTSRPDSEKVNKVPSILDTSLCENVIDGGNARLELAEELIASSPTAAFLMSFPLVSGNRADSPMEDNQSLLPNTTKDTATHKRNEIPAQPLEYYPKETSNLENNKIKSIQTQSSHSKDNKIPDVTKSIQTTSSSKSIEMKKTISNPISTSIITTAEIPFLNLTMVPTVTSSTFSDANYPIEFDCNISKSLANQTLPSSNNIFYKDPFNTMKSSIYSTCSISAGHDLNGRGLYPCAMEKYTSKSKTDFANVDENIMKIGSSRLTYDIDLGWSHKGLDFANSTTNPPTFSRDNILNPVSTTYTTSYNPFNPEFHVPLMSNTNRKENSTSKATVPFSDSIPSFYPQTTSLWSDEMPFYTSSTMNSSKSLAAKAQNYFPIDHTQQTDFLKPSNINNYETKQPHENVVKSSNYLQTPSAPEKYNKKSPNKTHINWMTSETRTFHNNFGTISSDTKTIPKLCYTSLDKDSKKSDHNEGLYFPISIHNCPPQVPHEDLQTWPTTRALGTTEISIDPPPINLPTLVGDLALGPHDKNRKTDINNRNLLQQDSQNCNNFLSVTQLMNRTDHMTSRYHSTNNTENNNKMSSTLSLHKQISNAYMNETNRKGPTGNNLHPNNYAFNETKSMNSYEPVNQYSNQKNKISKTSDSKNSKLQKNNYSAESLIRGGSCNQKVPNSKYPMPSQKYIDYTNQHDNSIAQVSHYPPILDYSDNAYAGQQFSGASLYNSTTNTMSNTFYTNFMPGSSNIMSSNYTGAPFTSDFIDYSQTNECNYTNQKYEEFKMKGNLPVYHHDKPASSSKGGRRDTSTKHKLDCNKKESSRKGSKRPKLTSEVEDWTVDNNLLWQNKTPSKRHSNLVSDELTFPNYMGNQMASQYQSDLLNSHLMTNNMQTMGHTMDRPVPTSFPATSRANFNLSTIFPEITMKVQ